MDTGKDEGREIYKENRKQVKRAKRWSWRLITEKYKEQLFYEKGVEYDEHKGYERKCSYRRG